MSLVEKQKRVIVRRSFNPEAAPACRRVPEDDAMDHCTRKLQLSAHGSNATGMSA